VDPGFYLVGPIEVSHMAVHIEPYNIHRVRRVPGKDETWFYLERHRKTVLNEKGKRLKIWHNSILRLLNERHKQATVSSFLHYLIYPAPRIAVAAFR